MKEYFEDIEQVYVDPPSGLRNSEDCKSAVLLPFYKGTAPTEIGACANLPVAQKSEDKVPAKIEVKPVIKPEVKPAEKKNWLQRLFN